MYSAEEQPPVPLWVQARADQRAASITTQLSHKMTKRELKQLRDSNTVLMAPLTDDKAPNWDTTCDRCGKNMGDAIDCRVIGSKIDLFDLDVSLIIGACEDCWNLS